MSDNNTEYATSAIDVVCVLDSDFNQIFESARPIKATVREEAKLMEHPVETGATVVDHRVIQPVEIELSFLITSDDYVDVYQAIKQQWHDGATLSVQTRTDSYDNMTIVSLPHEESPDIADGITLALKLREVMYVATQFTERKIPVKAAPKNTATKDRGEQRSQDTGEPKQSSFLSKLGLFK